MLRYRSNDTCFILKFKIVFGKDIWRSYLSAMPPALVLFCCLALCYPCCCLALCYLWCCFYKLLCYPWCRLILCYPWCFFCTVLSLMLRSVLLSDVTILLYMVSIHNSVPLSQPPAMKSRHLTSYYHIVTNPQSLNGGRQRDNIHSLHNNQCRHQRRSEYCLRRRCVLTLPIGLNWVTLGV